MTFECFSEYQNNPQLFAALVQALNGFYVMAFLVQLRIATPQI